MSDLTMFEHMLGRPSADEPLAPVDLVEVARSILLAPYIGLLREPCPVCCEACFTVADNGTPTGPCATCAGKGYIITEGNQ